MRLLRRSRLMVHPDQAGQADYYQVFVFYFMHSSGRGPEEYFYKRPGGLGVGTLYIVLVR